MMSRPLARASDGAKDRVLTRRRRVRAKRARARKGKGKRGQDPSNGADPKGKGKGAGGDVQKGRSKGADGDVPNNKGLAKQVGDGVRADARGWQDLDEDGGEWIEIGRRSDGKWALG